MDFDWILLGQIATNVSALSVTLMRLQEYVQLLPVTVRGYTNAGAGPYSDPVTVLTNEVW